jgi:small GTP-binding protein
VGGSIQVKMHIWDTGGSEKFRSMISLYYKDAAAAIICYDVSDEKSFNSVHYWINEMHNNNNNDSENFVMALAGNKSDLDPAQKKISFQTAKELAKKHNMIFAESSAKTGEGV